VAGDRRHAEALIAETERAIAPPGLTLSKAMRRVVAPPPTFAVPWALWQRAARLPLGA